MSKLNQTRKHRNSQRNGAAVVEFAILAPVLLTFILGVIDVGQYVNVGHVLSGASREGARKACRATSDNTSDVQTAVQTYLNEAFPALAGGSSGFTVTVADGNGTAISGAGLGATAQGDEIRVTVVLDYDTVRWMSGTPFYTGQNLNSTTVMRRE